MLTPTIRPELQIETDADGVHCGAHCMALSAQHLDCCLAYMAGESLARRRLATVASVKQKYARCPACLEWEREAGPIAALLSAAAKAADMEEQIRQHGIGDAMVSPNISTRMGLVDAATAYRITEAEDAEREAPNAQPPAVP